MTFLSVIKRNFLTSKPFFILKGVRKGKIYLKGGRESQKFMEPKQPHFSFPESTFGMITIRLPLSLTILGPPRVECLFFLYFYVCCYNKLLKLSFDCLFLLCAIVCSDSRFKLRSYTAFFKQSQSRNLNFEKSSPPDGAIAILSSCCKLSLYLSKSIGLHYLHWSQPPKNCILC